jgi:CRISPR-associated protein Csb2
MKMVTPVHLESSDTVHYAWRIPDGDFGILGSLERIVMTLVALGWGVDLAFGAARQASESEIRSLAGERWMPVTRAAGTTLRVAVPGTLDALTDRHTQFQKRLAIDGRFTPTPPLTQFRRCHYARTTDRPSRPFAAFQFLSLEQSGFRSFRATQTAKVAAMVRHAVAVAAHGVGRSGDGVSPEEWVDLYVHGHQRDGAPSVGRFSYLPVPTLDPRGVVDRVRRVMVAEPLDGNGQHSRWVAQSLVGEQLINEDTNQPDATMALCPESDYVLSRYVKTSRRWCTVTPVVLPWGDRGKPNRAEKQFLKAVRHAGFDVDDIAGIELRREPFWRGSEVAGRYFVPKHLRGTATWHVMLEWKRPIAGPLSIGSGRHYGLGLFAVVDG